MWSLKSFLTITQVSSRLEKIFLSLVHASLATIKSCHNRNFVVASVWPCIVSIDYLSALAL